MEIIRGRSNERQSRGILNGHTSGLVIDSQRVNWTAFAILAVLSIFTNVPQSPLLPTPIVSVSDQALGDGGPPEGLSIYFEKCKHMIFRFLRLHELAINAQATIASFQGVPCHKNALLTKP